MSLEKKEKYRGLALKIEDENKEKTPEHHMLEVKKISDALNKDIYKKQVEVLKTKMNAGDTLAFTQYSNLLKKAKEFGIK